MRQTGLQRLKKDRRHNALINTDYSYHRTFGAVPLTGLPAEFLFLSSVLDQNGFPHCTAYSAAAEEASEFNVAFDDNSAEDFFVQEGVINGRVQDGGYDLRTKMETRRKYGMIPANGPKDDAPKYKIPNYFTIHPGAYDLYDSIKSSIWREWTVNQKRRAPTIGMMWFDSWQSAPNGVIPDSKPTDPIGLHDVCCKGWSRSSQFSGIPFPDGQERLCIQNSFGQNVGDGGFFYFTREQVNQYFTEGVMIASDKSDDLTVYTISLIQNILNFVSQLLRLDFLLIQQRQNPPPVIVPDQDLPPPVPPVKPSKLGRFCKAIELHENIVKILNNPGAFRYNDFTKTFPGVTGKSVGGFCRFDTYEHGWEALQQFVRWAANDELKGYHNCTIRSFFETYSPTSDGNNPKAYADFVASYCDQKPTDLLKTFI